MSQDLTQLINLNRQLVSQNNKLINQNDEIIALLKRLAGDEEDIEEDFAEDIPQRLLLDTDSEVGTVYFIEDKNIFCLTVKNNKTSINNLTSSCDANEFGVQELIANESIKNNIEVPSSTVILGDEINENLPETLKICIENGCQNAFIPWKAMSQLIRAPQELMTLINLDFYKTNEELIEKLFKK